MNKPPHDWLPALITLLQHESVVVRVVIAEARGSVPREPGAFMLVGHTTVEGTVGGGRLEWESIAAARELLNDTSAAARLNRVVLAADVGQCCGGVVSLWVERFTRQDVGPLKLARDAGARGFAVLSTTVRGASLERRIWDCVGADGARAVGAGVEAEAIAAGVAELLREPRPRAGPRAVHWASGEVTLFERLDDPLPPLWLYGAGHVGQALARILTELPLRFTWIDSRAELFPAALPAEVRVRSDADSVATVSDAPVGAYFLVMTHSHPLDYELVRAILRRNDFAWLGLIGSRSKAARFRSRLTREGFGADRIARLVSPIGIPGIESKWPAAIAVAVAAQLMQEIGAQASDALSQPVRSAVGLPPAVLPSADCGREDCSTCGTRRTRLE
jgi:xanthine dehydrogenase accessory factor